jgi:hypothetical protein
MVEDTGYEMVRHVLVPHVASRDFGITHRKDVQSARYGIGRWLVAAPLALVNLHHYSMRTGQSERHAGNDVLQSRHTPLRSIIRAAPDRN